MKKNSLYTTIVLLASFVIIEFIAGCKKETDIPVVVTYEATMITDSEAPFIISREDQTAIDLVIVGSDALDADGSAVNKVGSYGISLSAHQARIPFYVTTTLLKFSSEPILIELRSPSEIWKDKPTKLKILNPAFDKIPAAHITYFITEVGLVKPSEIASTVKKNFPWIT